MGNRIDYAFGKGTEERSKDVVIRIGEVISVDDEYHGMRIKVRLEQDNGVTSDQIPYAFPLLPKTLQSIPKIGEAVLIILSTLSNKNSIRYYIGPLISQPQYFHQEYYNGGRGTSSSLLQGSLSKPLETIDHYDETKGSFPETNDIALVGRKSEDIVLKDGEIAIRCGIRGQKLFDVSSPEYYDIDKFSSLKGDVVFNKTNPAYLQLKYQRGICKGNKQVADSVINVVADKINLISHKDRESFELTDQKDLIVPENLDNIMSKLHQVPYGDVLKETLTNVYAAIKNHTHQYPGLPPVECPFILKLDLKDLENLLSEHVRIS
jgi:hypothetical protein